MPSSRSNYKDFLTGPLIVGKEDSVPRGIWAQAGWSLGGEPRAIAATTTIKKDDGIRWALVTTGDAGLTVTLPPAADCPARTILFKKIDAGAGALTIDGNGAETIEGLASVVLRTQYDWIEIASDGTSWYQVSGNVIVKPAGKTLTLSRTSSNPTIKGYDTGSGDSLILDSYDTDGIVALQYYLAGNVVLCYGSGTGGGTVSLGTTDIEAWSTDYVAIEAYRSAIMMGRANDSIYLISNAYYDGAWKYKAAAAACTLIVDGSSRVLSFQTVASGTIDTGLTFQAEMVATGGTSTYLSLGGAAGGSDRDVYIELASDAYFHWDESEASVSVYATGVQCARFRAATTELMVATTVSAANMRCAASAGLQYIYVSTSSGRYKTRVRDIEKDETDAVLSLRPVAFHSLCESDPKDREYHGFIAEEVEQLGIAAWMEYEKDGKTPASVAYSAIIPALTKRLQLQEIRILALEQTLTAAGRTNA